MTATLPDRPTHATSVREVADSLEVPEGWRVEIIGGAIVVSPTPTGKHGRIVRALDKALTPRMPEGHDLETNLGVNKAPDSEDYYIPDLFVAPEDVLDTWDSEVPPTELLLAAEVVSPSNADVDRVLKLKQYAQAGIPLYLLVDPLRAEITLYSDPVKGEYRARHRVEWGEKIALPKPFDVMVDSSRFPSCEA
jgi:Uma2 family endonuclease